jgi:hypothetical protein
MKLSRKKSIKRRIKIIKRKTRKRKEARKVKRKEN